MKQEELKEYYSINRNILECKCYPWREKDKDAYGINRNILECKYDKKTMVCDFP